MKFSDDRRLKKYISLGLSVCLVAALFAGCKREDKEPQGGTDTSPNLNLDLNTTPQTPSTSAPTEAPTEPTEKITDKTGVVLSEINVRASPTQDARVVTTLPAGQRVEVVRQEEMLGTNWGYIPESGGWVVMDYIKMDMEQNGGADTSTPAGNGDVPTPTPAPGGTTAPTNTTQIKGVITGNQVNIRSEASTNGKVQGAYNKGDTVTILETKNGWGRTDKGWVKMDYVSTTGGNTNTNTNTNTNATGNGSTTVQFRGVVTAKELNIRSRASQDSDRLGSYAYGKRVEFYEKDGNWGRTKDGWISLSYVYQDGTTGNNTAKGTVTADGLRIRSGPGTGYDVVGSYGNGDTVTILAQFTYGDTTWGAVKNGWISLDYVNVEGKTDNWGDSNDDDGGDNWGDSSSDSRTGTVTGTGLRIRSGPGTGYGVVGSYGNGDRVTVHETRDVDGTTWGRTGDGWISLDYVNMD